MEISGTILNQGNVTGNLLILQEPLSFWGGFDPNAGSIIDHQHPQKGEVLTNKIIAMSSTRGSAGTPGILGESLRIGTGPLGIILTVPDINITSAALVVSTLYDHHCPVMVISNSDFKLLSFFEEVAIKDGKIINIKDFNE